MLFCYHEIPTYMKNCTTIRSDYDSIKVKEIVAKTYELECTFRMDLKPLWTTLLDEHTVNNGQLW